jgi:glycosyltransferase involved in cell wall biosynthesis
VTNPGITAILPCYNHQKYLPARIHSVVNQTLPPSEIIFLDDASTDDSFQLAKSLLSVSHIDVSLHRNKTNSGSPFSQWNKGVLLAKYPFIWIAETDDTCDLGFLEQLSGIFHNTDVVLVYSQSYYISGDDEPLGTALSYTSSSNLYLLQQNFVIDGRDYNSSFMAKRNSIPNASGVLFKRAAYIKVGLANVSMRFCGDWDMWIQIAAQGRVGYVASKLNYFRCHNLTTRSKGNTPRFAAEALACRLSARAITLSRHSFTVTAPWFFRQLFTRQSSNLSSICSHIKLSSFNDIYYHYYSLSNQPCLTKGAWLFILIYVIFKTIQVTSKRIVQRLSDDLLSSSS